MTMRVYNTHTISVTRQTFDKWGDVATETSTDYRGRYNVGNRLITDADGQEVISTGMVSLGVDVDVELGDRITVDGVERQLIAINPQMGFKLEGYRIYLS